MHLSYPVRKKVMLAGLTAVVVSVGALMALCICSGCVTEQRNGYSAVRMVHLDTPIVDNDTWVKWPWTGDPLAWVYHKVFGPVKSTNTVVEAGVSNKVSVEVVVVKEKPAGPEVPAKKEPMRTPEEKPRN